MSYDSKAAAAFYDAYGEREWTRFEDGRTPATSVATHVHYLEQFVHAGDHVLDVGCGPGRFTLELARLGARVAAADVSPGQLELHRQYTESTSRSSPTRRSTRSSASAALFPTSSTRRRGPSPSSRG